MKNIQANARIIYNRYNRRSVDADFDGAIRLNKGQIVPARIKISGERFILKLFIISEGGSIQTFAD